MFWAFWEGFKGSRLLLVAVFVAVAEKALFVLEIVEMGFCI